MINLCYLKKPTTRKQFFSDIGAFLIYNLFGKDCKIIFNNSKDVKFMMEHMIKHTHLPNIDSLTFIDWEALALSPINNILAICFP